MRLRFSLAPLTDEVGFAIDCLYDAMRACVPACSRSR